MIVNFPRTEGDLRPNSDAVAGHERWMTLLEALEHIRSVEKCDSVAAQVHLKNGIGQRLIPVKWADSKGLKDKPDVDILRRSQLVFQALVLPRVPCAFAPC